MSKHQRCRPKNLILSFTGCWVFLGAAQLATSVSIAAPVAPEVHEEKSSRVEDTPAGKRYVRSLVTLQLHFETALIRQRICGEAFPALRAPTRTAYRAWEVRHVALREEIGRKYFHLLLKDAIDVADASVVQDAILSVLERTLQNQPSDQLELICASYVDSFTGLDADPNMIFASEIAAIRAYAAGSAEMPPDALGKVDPICEQGDAALIGAAYAILGDSRPAIEDEMVGIVERIATRCPASVLRLQPIELIEYAVRHAESGSERRLRVLEALFRAGWKGMYGDEASRYWRELTVLYLDRGRVEEARLAAARVANPMTVVGLLIDKRYDDVTSGDAEHFDVDARTSAEVARWRSAVARYPRSPMALYELLKLLNRVGRHNEVLELTERFSEGIDSLTTIRKAFHNADATFVSILLERARAYEAMGEPDLAEPLLRAAATHEPRNASRWIRLALLHQGQSRSDEALSALESIEATARIGNFNRMLMAWVKYRVAVHKGDQESAATHFAYIEEHKANAMFIFTWTLLYAGEEERCAQDLIERLENPEKRVDALLSLQDFLPHAVPLDHADLEARWKKLVLRADVRAAAEKVGRIRAFNLVHD